MTIFKIVDKFNSESVLFTADVSEGSYSDMLGQAVIQAIAANADLRSADLRSADLSYADLRSADLSYANLRYANLRYADLRYANGANLAIAMTRILPEGGIIGWKKCADNVIVKLEIPGEAKRSHAFGRKCRAEFADVLEVFGAEVGISTYNGVTEYRPGRRVFPDSFSEDWEDECATGIHFFITREEAEAYVA